MKKFFLMILMISLLTIAMIISPSVLTVKAEETDKAGFRDKLEEKGISFEVVYTGESVSNTEGGIENTDSYLGNLDITMTLDTGQAGLWDDGTFFVYILENHGGRKPTAEFIGDLQAVSNIEASHNTLRLYEIWYEQQFLDNTFSVLLGQHDLNSEFVVTEYGGLFLNSSFGIQPDISANVPVSIFPVAAPGVRIKWQPNKGFYIMAAVYDGDPGSPEVNNHGTRWILSSAEGAMTIYEAGYSVGGNENGPILPGTYKVGAWYHTADFDDVIDTDDGDNPIRHNGDHGVYFIADQMVYREKEDEGLGLFFQIGGAPDNRNEVDFYIGGGANYRGLIPGRDEDDFGIALARASISDKLRSAGGRDFAETTLEITYRAQITPWFAVQPDVQFVSNPGADPGLKDAIVTLLRFEVAL